MSTILGLDLGEFKSVAGRLSWVRPPVALACSALVARATSATCGKR
jgi:hypothetical protein